MSHTAQLYIAVYKSGDTVQTFFCKDASTRKDPRSVEEIEALAVENDWDIRYIENFEVPAWKFGIIRQQIRLAMKPEGRMYEINVVLHLTKFKEQIGVAA